MTDQIRLMLESFAAAWKSNDGAAVAGFFTEDGTLINPFGQRADGRHAVEAMYTKYFGEMLRGTSTRIDLASARVDGEHAFVDAEQTVEGPDGNVVLAVHLAALLRNEGGSWRFVDARPYVLAGSP